MKETVAPREKTHADAFKNNSSILKGIHIWAIAVVSLVLVGYSGKAVNAQSIDVLRPIANAIVRETVPIKVSPRDVPPDGYVTISVDGQMIAAKVLPTSPGSAVFEWDTKQPYATPDDPQTKKVLPDGSHQLTISIFSSGNHLVGSSTIPVRVANMITPPSQGVVLKYKWQTDDELTYQDKTVIKRIFDQGNYSSGKTTPIKSADIKFVRSVEDVTGGTFLIRDKVMPGESSITNGNLTRFVNQLYNIKSVYRTVDFYGNVISEMAPLSGGDHFSFSLPTLPTRRVTIGDSWQSPIKISFDWNYNDPLTVTGEARLEDFEWQNGYPTAKIRETFTGSAKFPSGKTRFSNASVTTLKIDRIIYFAYNSGRVISDTVKVDAVMQLTAAQIASLSSSGASRAATGPAGAPPGYGMPPGIGGPFGPGGYPGMTGAGTGDDSEQANPSGPPPGFGGPPGYGPNSGDDPSAGAGAPMGPYGQMGPMGPMGPYGAGGNTPGTRTNTTVAARSAVHLNVDSDTDLILTRG